jgi:hypothetical protein
LCGTSTYYSWFRNTCKSGVLVSSVGVASAVPGSLKGYVDGMLNPTDGIYPF